MKPNYDSIYLSPHLDDAALSCGGQIFEQTRAGKDVLIVTVAAADPETSTFSSFAQFLHHHWGLTATEAMAMRRAEDVAACRRLGADYLHWTLPDAIYRRHPQTGAFLYESDAALFGQLHTGEGARIGEIAARIKRLPRAGRIVVPLTVGNHVDHQLTRAAAEKGLGAEWLFYYEDYPYVQRHPAALAALLQPAGAWRSQLIPLTDAAMQARLDAILQYRSQINVLFNDVGALRAQLREIVDDVGGERLWYRVGSPGADRVSAGADRA